MKGLILKDLLNLRKYGKTVFLICAFYLILMLMMDSATVFGGMIVLMFTITSITSFVYDSQCGWDVYAMSLPVSRKDIVLSKYVLSLFLAFLGGILSLLVFWLHGIFARTGNFLETLAVSYALFAVAVVFICILLPLVYRFGVERSRILIIAVVAIPTAVIMVLSQSGTVIEPDEKLISQVLGFSPLVLVVCVILSYLASGAIFNNKEM